MKFILNGCQEGKATARLVEVECPKCGAEMEVFEHLGSQRAGRTETAETCSECGYVVPIDTYLQMLKKIVF